MINFNLNNRIAIVTGGAQGFGFSISDRFIQSGAKVIIWDIDELECKNAIKKINSENCSFEIVDVQHIENIKSKLNEIEKIFGKIDIFINNAGIAGPIATVENYPIDEWKKVLNKKTTQKCATQVCKENELRAVGP